MQLRLHKARDSITICYNFFDFITILFDRDMHPDPKADTLKYAIRLCNRHTPIGKSLNLERELRSISERMRGRE